MDSLTGDAWQKAFRFLALDRLQTRLHRWRFNLVTGATSEEQLTDSITEFGMINAGYAGRDYRYAYAATGKPGWFLFDGLVKHDLHTGSEERFAFDDGVYGSETAMAPRSNVAGRAAPGSNVAGRAAPGTGSTGEDDGYLVTLTTDMTDDASYCLVFDAARVADGPVCKLRSARTDFQRHPLDLGRRIDRCGAGSRPTTRPPRSGCRWSSPSPTPSPACSDCSATNGRCW